MDPQILKGGVQKIPTFEILNTTLCVYTYIQQLSSFRAPTLCFIDLTVATFLKCLFFSRENGQNTFEVHHFDTIRNGYKARKALILREPCLSGVKIKCTQVNGVKRIFVFGLPTVTGLKLILILYLFIHFLANLRFCTQNVHQLLKRNVFTYSSDLYIIC